MDFIFGIIPDVVPDLHLFPGLVELPLGFFYSFLSWWTALSDTFIGIIDWMSSTMVGTGFSFIITSLIGAGLPLVLGYWLIKWIIP